MEKVIQFVANYDDWRAIKKLKIDEKTDPRTVMEFIASLSMSFDAKVEGNLRKVIDLEKVDAVLEEISCGKTEEEIAEALKAVRKRNVSAAINEICEKPELQKNEQKELKQFCKIYAVKKVLKNCDLEVDYSGVNIPGIKRVKKKKV